MSITFGFHPVAVLAALVLAGALSWWVYRRTTPQLAPARRWLLAGLRFTGLAIIILLLAEPVLRSVFRSSRNPVVALVIDGSRSLSSAVVDPDQARVGVGELAEKMSSSLAADVRTFVFSEGATALPDRIDSIRFEGPRTDISAALVQVSEALQGERLAAVVLVSDGLYNTGRNPVYEAEESLVPIHTIVVGDTTARRDISIQRVTTNEIAYVNRDLPLRIALRSDGFEAQPVVVTVESPQSEPVSETVLLPDGRGEVDLDLQMRPRRSGLHPLRIEVEPVDGELTTANNVVDLSIRVLERKLRLLMVAGAPSPDVAALNEMISSDDDIEITLVVQRNSESYYGASVPADLSDFDAILVVGYPGRHADRDAVRRIVDSEKPTFFVLDHSTDLRRVEDELSGVIPFAIRTVRPAFSEASAIPTSRGVVHPVLEVSPGAANLVRLPPLAYSQSLLEPAPDASTLATVAIRGIELGDPLIVVRERAGLRSAALLGAGIWRWRNVPEDLKDLRRLTPELVLNTVRWMTAEVDERPVRVYPAQEFFDGSDAVRLTGQVYDESMNPVESASIIVKLVEPDGNDFTYTMDPIGNGRYTKDLGQLRPGQYRFAASAEREGSVIGADSGSFAVGELSLEFRETRADPHLMHQIARRSGGISVVGAGNVSALVDSVAAREALQPIVIEEASDLPLRGLPVFMFLSIAAFATEWLFRKRSGLI
jgi:hypothetical protein